MGAQFYRVDAVTFEDLIEGGEEIVKGGYEFGAILTCDLIQIADNPADRFIFPFAGETEEAIVGGDVWEERKCPAAEDSIRSLTLVRAEAGEQDHAGGQVRVREG